MLASKREFYLKSTSYQILRLSKVSFWLNQVCHGGHYTWKPRKTWKYMEILVHIEKNIEKKVFEKTYMKIHGKVIFNVLQEVTFFYILVCILFYLHLPRSRL